MILFTILMLTLVINLIIFAIKLSWGIFKIIFGVITFPLVLISLALGGLIRISMPILIVALIVLLIQDYRASKKN